MVEAGDDLVGFGLLVHSWPETWPDPSGSTRLPVMIDLFVGPDQRGRGAGSRLIRWMEERAAVAGSDRIQEAVDPVGNPGALQLYRRLGYEPVQDEPYRSRWRFTDSSGGVHEGTNWQIDLSMDLTG